MPADGAGGRSQPTLDPAGGGDAGGGQGDRAGQGAAARPADRLPGGSGPVPPAGHRQSAGGPLQSAAQSGAVAAAGGAAAVLAGGAVVLLDTDAAADDFALFAISNTVEAIEGLPSPPPNNDPLDTCLAALANAPAGLDGTSLLLAPVGVAVVSAFTSSSPSITSGLQFSLLL